MRDYRNARRLRNINRIPSFERILLVSFLGSANSWLMTHCQENRVLSAVRILTRLRCYYYRDLHWRSVHWISRPSFYPNHHAHLPHTSHKTQSRVSVLGFSPVHFRGPQPRQVSCYAFFEGWLLLSLPPCCFRSKTPFCLTLSQNLGTLTLVWVNPLSVMRLTPHKPASPRLCVDTFGVQEESGPFRILVFSLVLYSVNNIGGDRTGIRFDGN